MKDNVTGNSGDTISCPNCWTVRGALPGSILYNWAVSQELREAILKKRLDSRAWSQAIAVQTQMQSFNFFFGMQLRVLVLRHTGNSSLLYNKNTCTCPVIKLSKLQKYIFHYYKAWDRKLVSACFFKKVTALNQKLEIDVQKSPLKGKVLSHYEEGEAPVEVKSIVEQHYHQIFISAEILHWNSPGDGNTAFKASCEEDFGYEL